jgi:protein-disulfide isomerase
MSTPEARLAVPVGVDDHVLGSEDARLTLVEYGDYECPYCAQALLVVRELRQTFGGDLRYVFRNMPLADLHPHAERAAEAAEAVGLQGRFWAMHDLLFENQSDLTDTALLRYAAEAGADARAVAEALTAGTAGARIEQEVEGGIRSGVNGTPTFFVNGVRYDGMWSLEPFAEYLKLRAAASGGGASGR